MSDLDLKDLELKEHDPYHDYIEDKIRDAEFESLNLLEEELEAKKDFLFNDDYIYHIMWPTFYLSNGNEWL